MFKRGGGVVQGGGGKEGHWGGALMVAEIYCQTLDITFSTPKSLYQKKTKILRIYLNVQNNND